MRNRLFAAPSGRRGQYLHTLRPQRKILLLACMAATLAVISASLYGQQPKAGEYQVKAVYLYNFSKFVTWPAQTAEPKTEPFTICVLGKDPFGSFLDKTVAGENIGGQSLLARRVSKAQEALGCRIVFVSASEEERLREILTVLDKTSILTVSDIPRFSQRGGMIQFVSEGERVRFEVNLTNVQQTGLTLSSDLLKVAVAVRKNP